jgi:Cytidylyltransferase-like
MIKSVPSVALASSFWLLGPSPLCPRLLLPPSNAIRLPVILPFIGLNRLSQQQSAFHTFALTRQSTSTSRNSSAGNCTVAIKRSRSSASRMDAYNFPEYRLKKKMDDPSKTPLLLVACGSFSPITFLHLRMFVMAADYVKFSTDFEIVGGYLSPVSEAYKKAGLASAEHR